MKPALHRIEAVGFDFGGTIVPIIRDRFNKILAETLSREFGTNRAREIVSFFLQRERAYWDDQSERQSTNLVLDMLVEAADAVGANLSTAELRRAVSAIAFGLVTDIKPRPLAYPTIACLARNGLLVGLLSNWLFPTAVLHEWLAVHGLGSYFSCVLGSADLGVRKPRPEAFYRLTAGLGLATVHSLAYVGDNFTDDIIGAVDAGCGLAIWLAGVEERHSQEGVVIARSLADIPRLLC